MKIAILGWGSLLWEGGAEFDKWHGNWAYDGPKLKIEFSRISHRRLGALTLVLDNDQGTPTTVAWCLSKRATLEEALSDLRIRENATIAQIGRVIISPDIKPQKASDAADQIGTWARANNLDAVIWTALGSNFREKTNHAFSVTAATEYLNSLGAEAKVKAAEYIWRGPNFVMTPLRAAIEIEPWFKSSRPIKSR